MTNPSQKDLAFPATGVLMGPVRPRASHSGIRLQMALLIALFGFGFSLMAATLDEALLITLLLFTFVTISGTWLCNSTMRTLNDRQLRVLPTFWLIKMFATLVLLYLGWIPQLDSSSSASWGYDPQRYYEYSWDLVQNNWNPYTLQQNYQGIMYYYGAIFSVFGRNPVIPALINSYVTLLGTLFLILAAYHFMPVRTHKDWRIAYILLVPEILWYDVMTSRETLMAVMIIASILPLGRYLFSESRSTLTLSLLTTIIFMVGVLAVRTSMILPVFASIVGMVLLVRSRRTSGPFIKAVFLLIVVIALLVGPWVQSQLGGYDIEYLRTLDRLQSFEANVAAQMEWGDQSIGLLLAPSNLWQSLAFLPPRMILYLAAPLPNVAVSISELISGYWGAWQKLMTIPTSMLILLGFPYVLAGTSLAWRVRKAYPTMLILPLTFWITFAAVAGGNIIIHERYRLMFTLLLFACMWIGYTQCRGRQVKRWAVPWFGMLGAGAVLYMVYKFI